MLYRSNIFEFKNLKLFFQKSDLEKEGRFFGPKIWNYKLRGLVWRKNGTNLISLTLIFQVYENVWFSYKTLCGVSMWISNFEKLLWNFFQIENFQKENFPQIGLSPKNGHTPVWFDLGTIPRFPSILTTWPSLLGCRCFWHFDIFLDIHFGFSLA